MKRRVKNFFALLLLLFLCMVGNLLLWDVISIGAAQQTHRPIRIGYIDYDGFFVEDANGRMTGYGVEFLEEISKYTGWEYAYIYDSWENHMKNLAEGNIDFICHAQKTPEREENYLFSKYSIGAESGVLYVDCENEDYYYNDFAAFDGMKIAVLQDSFQNESFLAYAKEMGFSCTLLSYPTQNACFEALEKQEADGVVLGSLALKSDYKVVCRFGSEPFYFMSGKENIELVNEVDRALGEIKVSEPYFEAELFQKYYGEGVAVTDPALTREEVELIKDCGQVTVAFIPDLKPMSYVDENGEIAGITVDIVKKIEEKSGLDFRYVMMDVGMKPIDYMKAHPEQMVAGVMTENPDFHNEDTLVSDCFYTDEVVLAGKKGREYALDDPKISYRVAIPQSYAALENYIIKSHPEFELVGADSTDECIHMVLDGKADLLAQNVNAITPLLSKPQHEELVVLPAFFMQERAGIAFADTEENRIIMHIIDKCIETIGTRESAQIIVDHTVTNGYELTLKDIVYKFRYATLIVVLLGSLVLILITVLFAVRRRNYLRLEIKNRQLADAVVQADNANYAKSCFLATMSHEIRTPLNAVMGLLELAGNYVDNPPKMEEYLKKIQTSSKMLLTIINDILDMSAIESNKLKLAKESFALSDVLESVHVVYAETCRQKKVDFVLDMTEVKNNRIFGDEYRLRQIVLNLVSNACKFTPSGGKIILRIKEVPARQEKSYFNFSVTDTGEGMSEEMLERIFKPFEQEDASTARKHGGSGLGLSITKNLVELMRGTISCKSKKGEGTTFKFSIPFELDLGYAVKEISADEVTEEEEITYDFHGVRILLAEDTKINADIAKELLAMVNIQTEHAWNGKEAVEMFMQAEPEKYAAVLMDIQMPEMDGYEATKAIRASSHVQAKQIPIYAMSANAYEEDVSLSLNAGMNGHIAKPIDTKLLYQTLYQAIFQKP